MQAALLEAMEERQVTIGETSYPLPDPFFVLATENPIEHEGTYPLPEAELDRFLLKLLVSYPSPEEELAVIRRSPSFSSVNNLLEPLQVVLDGKSLSMLREAADAVHIDEKITEYIVSIICATRPAGTSAVMPSPSVNTGVPGTAASSLAGNIYRYISFGASPRASIALHRCSRILALFSGKEFVGPEEVKIMAFPVLRHRIVLAYEAEADGLDADAVISRILSHVPVP